MKRQAMVFACALAIFQVAPNVLARVTEEPGAVRVNVVSSAIKQKRSEGQTDAKPIQFAMDVNGKASTAQRKLSSDLLVKSVYYHNSVTSMPTRAMMNSAIQATVNEMVNCEITCEVSDRLLVRIAELGGRVVSSSSRFGSIHAFLPLAALEILSKDESIKRIREAHKPMLNKVNTSEGDISHRAASARSMYGVSGTGIKIGVISDSVRYLDQIQSSGDLPSNVTVLPGLSGILDDESDIGEGTAMLEIVHDLCPGAALYFATAGETEAEMAESIIALKNAGCDIIVDDICFRSESAFQDGIIASAVKDVYDSGKIYVTCAANKGNYDSGYSGVWEGDFNPASETVTLGGVEYEQHVFPDGSTGNLINYWTANNVYTLQWSDPLGSSGNDYELAVYDYDTGTWLQKSGDEQNGDDDPYDWCRITSTMAAYKGLGLRVLKKKGAANRFIRVAAFNQPSQSGGRGRLEMSTPGMVYGHNASPYAISVAATEYVSNRAFMSSDKIAYYSSDGPRKMFYDITGTSYTTSKLASGGRSFNKPDFAAASSVSCATPDFETFGGTSAAAPHIAAICGLMLHANRSLTQTEVLDMLKSSVVSPYSGWNRTYGHGMVNAEECVRLAKESASGASSSREINIASGTTSGSCTVENDGSSWKIVESFPSWVKGITFYCPANGNVMSLTSNGTSVGFSGEASMTVNCTTNDTGAARSWDLSISNRTTKAIQYRVRVTQNPHVSVSPPAAPSLTGIATYGSDARTDYIQVGWSTAARATSYNVYRNTSNSTSGRTKVATNVTSPYKDYVSNGLTPGVKYWYWVEAVNSAGSSFSNSDWGNILVTASLSKTTLGFTAAGGTSNITVTANTSWSATKSDSWLSISTSGTSGNGSIAVTATPNTTSTARTGRVIVTAGAGTSYPKTVTNTITQSANASTGTYAIKFNRMDYSGTTLTYTFDVGIAQPLPRLWADMGWSYSEHEFLGWATNTYSSAEGLVGEVVFADGASVKDLAANGETAFLYAVWTTTSTVNDDFASATRISGKSGSIRGSTVGATSQSGEPLISYSPYATNTIWWAWTASASGNATFSTTNTAFDTVMGVYTGTSVSSLTAIKQDDDGGPNRTSICTFAATRGVTYYIAVSGYGNSNQGTVRLDWRLVESAQICTVTFNPNGGTLNVPSMATRQVEYGAEVGSLPGVSRVGYSLGSVWWWTQPEGGSYVTYRDIITSNVTFYAHWTANTYTISYNYDGGVAGATSPSSATYDTAFCVSAPTKSGYTFTGWTVTSGLNASTAKWGTTSSPSTSLTSSTTKCANGATGNVYFKNLTPTANGSVTLTANWAENAIAFSTALDNTTLTFTTGGGASWFGQTATTHDGVDAAQSGALGNSQTNWLQTTVSGTGTVSFWWYASSEQNWDFLEFLIDGSVVASMSGTNNVWTSKSFDISTSGTHTLQWRYRKDGSQYRGLDAGFVDQVTWTPSTSPTPTTYTVTYLLDGGTHGATHPTTATYDSAFYVSAPTKSGYTFTGWTVTSGLNTSTAKWGTSSNPSTTISSSSTKCVNGATGNVYFKNLTTTANGSVTLTANWTSSALPDLCPYTPVGWSGSLVLSTESQNATNSTATSFSPNDAIYVSLAVVNLGEGFSNDFNWALYVDDSLRTTGANWGSGLAANGSSRWFALSIGPLPTGTHTIKVVYDYTGLISESNESNNTVTKTVTVSGVVVRPSNDNFAGATTISGMSGLVTGSNVNATYESGEPLPNISAGATNTIWWTWTAPATGIAQFSTAGSKVSSTAMGAYVGSSVSALTTVSAYTQSSISFAVVSGTRYYIAVSGTGYRYQGTIKLNWSMFTPVPLNTALDNASLTFTTGGAASWVGVTNESYVGGSSARSGAISHSQSTWMQTEVSGKGTLSFWYKVSSESYCDKLIFYIDGVQKTTASGTGTAGWSRFECVVSNNTQHVLKWTYSKDGSVSSGSDCCWVDKVVWTPAGIVVDVGRGETVTVPMAWVDAHRSFIAATGLGDEEAVRNGAAANGRKIWECYVLGLDPEVATNDFRIVSFPMRADGTPDLSNIVFEPAHDRWNVPEARAVVKGAATLAGEWKAVEGATAEEKAAMRFFKVVVEVP